MYDFVPMTKANVTSLSYHFASTLKCYCTRNGRYGRKQDCNIYIFLNFNHSISPMLTTDINNPTDF